MVLPQLTKEFLSSALDDSGEKDAKIRGNALAQIQHNIDNVRPEFRHAIIDSHGIATRPDQSLVKRKSKIKSPKSPT